MDAAKRKPEEYVIEYAREVSWSAQAVYSTLKKQEITVKGNRVPESRPGGKFQRMKVICA
jgi:hypothetical protein